ncbi:MAG: membrane-bound O-acyltransferase family protein [Bacteroidetes bacterium]|nr:MAG: membrane-bound O-acyltransferase family protein [Bacteroidota bacterium]
MLFNSLDFALFLPIVFCFYWLASRGRLKIQNTFIVAASYFFYGFWDWKFLGLLIASTVIDFCIGRALNHNTNKGRRKLLLGLSVFVNIGLLGFFKYHNFFIQSFVDAFSFFGTPIEGPFLTIILPIGISFYTFQTLSYTIDIYRNKLKATNDFIAFAAFVSFFPQLVAGPIERAKNLLPQFLSRRKFNRKEGITGINQIIWGLFKKLVIADNCAQYANDIFNNYTQYSSLTLILGGVYFAFQIYADFSGYSDIAIGTARLFGFRLQVNFKYPYFSKNVAEFWRRWHISLSTWFRDYVFIPLGGSQVKNEKLIFNILIVFVVSGFWHGANWTFLVWGFLNGIFLIPIALKQKKSSPKSGLKSSTGSNFIKTLFTFTLITLGWIFFRSETLKDAYLYLGGIGKLNFHIDKLGIERYAFEALPIILIFVVIEWLSRQKEFPLHSGKHLLAKTIGVLAMILLLGSFSEMKEFIYFQF